MIKRVNLFAFPYAFGGANIYKELEMYIHKYINIIPINYPGHESRYSEKLLYSIQEIAEEVYNKICNKLEEDYSLLGYSMGGYVGYELYQIIKRNNKKLPLNIFIFATNEPDFKKMYKKGKNISSIQVKEILENLGGTPEEIIENEDFIEMITPVVNADTWAIENYIPTSYMMGKVDCPVTIIRGSEEQKSENCQLEWNKYFENECEYIIVEGEHFFMFEQDGKRFAEFAEIINNRIEEYFSVNKEEKYG